MHKSKVYMHILPVPLLVYYINLNISFMHAEHGVNGIQTSPQLSLPSKCHIVLWFMYECNFI